MVNPRSISASGSGVGWRTVRSRDTLSRSRGPLSRASEMAFLTTLAEYSSHLSSSRFRMNSSESALSKYSRTATPTWCLNSVSVSIGPYTALDVPGSYPRGSIAAALPLPGSTAAELLRMNFPSSSSYSGSFSSTGIAST